MKRVLLILLMVCVPMSGFAWEPPKLGIGDKLKKLTEKFPKKSNQDDPSTSKVAENGADSKEDHSKSPVEELAKEDISKATTIGKYTGAAVGGVAALLLCKKLLGGLCDTGAGQALAISAGGIGGAKLGALIGKNVGEKAANRRRIYASEQEYLESEIKASQKAIVVRKKGIKDTNQKIKNSEQRIAYLQKKSALTQKELAEAKELKASTDEELKNTEILLGQYTEKVAYLDKTLATSEAEAKAKKENISAWEKKYAVLKARRNKLQAQQAEVEQQKVALESSKEALGKLIA